MNLLMVATISWFAILLLPATLRIAPVLTDYAKFLSEIARRTKSLKSSTPPSVTQQNSQVWKKETWTSAVFNVSAVLVFVAWGYVLIDTNSLMKIALILLIAAEPVGWVYATNDLAWAGSIRLVRPLFTTVWAVLWAAFLISLIAFSSSQ
ncbi:hypothetical protein [Gloeobacter morelensis]|uniref:hypothetical protein n=1 Tax=Gloeobacter morelensis TaxID=2907343 RepID=UPI001E593638|nr:hypothetical protein [Gloeobacter morelensis]UFP97222.1 hypothetical protein ISF26_24175 [Gloeobacter morelensis MG652769]